MPPLVPCPSCSRHLRADEGACPFCRAALPSDLDQTLVPMPQTERGARAVLAPAVLVGLLAATLDCNAAVAPKYGAPPVHPDPMPQTNVETVAPAYGAPPVTAPTAPPPSGGAAATPSAAPAPPPRKH
ncbi:MAG: hypothetical protein U0235_10670 [Polyangiaceae bacterium]